jgi:hypothetical protein
MTANTAQIPFPRAIETQVFVMGANSAARNFFFSLPQDKAIFFV